MQPSSDKPNAVISGQQNIPGDEPGLGAPLANADHQPGRKRIFRLELPWKGPITSRLAPLAQWPIERLLSLTALENYYQGIRGDACKEFVHNALHNLNVKYDLSDTELNRIPKKGPVVVVANHPFGAIEGVLLADMLLRVRPDVKIMANYILGRIPQLRDLFLFVDPFGGENAAKTNLAPLKQSIRWLDEGGLLAIFPAGEVSSLDLKTRSVTDKPWTPMVGRLIRRSKATAVPVFFNGRNGAVFQIAGLVHPRLRTALLARQLMNKRNRAFDIRIGSAIQARKLVQVGDDQAMTDYLRQRTYMLKHRSRPQTPVAALNHPRDMKAIVAGGDAAAMEHEVRSLAPRQRLVEMDENLILVAPAQQIPNLIREVGRLREVAFRAAGEGSGKSLDLDQFDSHYQHLILWNQAQRQVVGAYRLGPSDQILAERGVAGFYTYELFEYRRDMLDRLGPALELGRSFVRLEAQRSYAPLLMLWKGLGRFILDNPRYRYLFGPVTISAAYQSTSVRLMVQFLKLHHGDQATQAMVSARTPFIARPMKGWDDARVSALARDDDELSDLVADLERDQKGLPVLIRQYLKLGAKFLSFNVDRSFGDCVDGLILVDLLKADRRALERYMGRDGVDSFWAHHGIRGEKAGSCTTR